MLTEKSIREVIADAVLNFDVSTLGRDTSFFDAGMDSLDHSSILLGVEERFGLKIPDDDVARCASIQAILDYAASRAGP
jgi:acyl carrier protein